MRNTLAASANPKWRAWAKEVPATGQRVRTWLLHGPDKLDRLVLLIQKGLDSQFDTPTAVLELSQEEWPQRLEAAQRAARETAARLAVAKGQRVPQGGDYDGRLGRVLEKKASEAVARATQAAARAEAAAAAAARAAKAAENAAAAAKTAVAALRGRLEQ